MSTSTALRLNEIESVFRLVHECRDLWADADAWQAHLLQGACRLTGTANGQYNEQRLSRNLRATQLLDESRCGSWRDEEACARMFRVYADHPDRLTYFSRTTQLAGKALRGLEATVLRPQMRADDEWYRSAFYNEYRRPAFVDGLVLSFAQNPTTGSLIMLTTNQDVCDSAPTQRAADLLSLLTRQIAPLVGTVLATRRQRGLHGLSPRMKQTLDRLLAGDSEKEIATGLGLGRTTIHDYVGALYRHFKVASRGELMAYFLHRRPQPSADVSPTQKRKNHEIHPLEVLR